MVKINKIVIHCSDSSFGNAALIDFWHRERGWNCIGYHYVICNGFIDRDNFNIQAAGLLETGRSIYEDGAHVKGFNQNSIGICLIGKSGKFNESQIRTLTSLLMDIKYWHFNPEIVQHSDLDPQKPKCSGIPAEFINTLNNVPLPRDIKGWK